MQLKFDDLDIDYIHEHGLKNFLKGAAILGILVGKDAYANERLLEANKARCIQDAARMITVEKAEGQTNPHILTHSSPFLQSILAMAASSGISVILSDDIWPDQEMMPEQSDLVLNYGSINYSTNVMTRTVVDQGSISPTTDTGEFDPYIQFKREAQGLQRWSRGPLPIFTIRRRELLDLRPKW